MALPFAERRLPHGLPAALRAVVFLSLAWAGFAGRAQAQRFSAPTTVTTGSHPGALLSADFTGTGTPELLALDAGAVPQASSVHVLANSGGALSVGSVMATAGSAILAMPLRPGQLPDLYWVSVSGNMATLERAAAQADGSYTPGAAVTTFPLSGSATPRLLLAAGGLHAGFENAIVVADPANSQLYTVLPNPDGTYAIRPVYGFPGLPLLAGASQLLSSDVNGDGVPDLLVAGASGVQVFLASSAGNGAFSGFGASTTYPCTGTVQSIALADMDGDAHPDLLVEGANGQIEIYHGNADGTFAAASEVGTGVDNAATGNGGHLVGVADLNGDGVPDLVLANPLGITVLLGAAGHSFQLAGTYALASIPGTFVFTDLNGDGRPDIAFDSPAGVTVMYAQSAVTGQLTASPEPSLYGAAITLTLTLTGAVNGLVPTGAVTFSVDGAIVGTAALTGRLATYTIAAPAYTVGSHTLSASYAGDGNYAPATFSGSHTVQGLPTVTTITSLVTPIYYGQEIGYTNGIDAVVGAYPASSDPPPPGATLDGGLIYVYLDGQLVCSLVSGGSAAGGGPQRCNDANFQGYPAGMHTMTGAYQGNGYYAPSTSVTYTVVILPDDTTDLLTTSLTPSPLGAAVTFTATLTAPYAIPTGPVAFFDGPKLLGSGTLNAQGIATFTTSTLALGAHNIIASYAATQNFNASQNSLTQVVDLISAVLLTSSLNPSTVGQSVTFTATAALTAVSTPAAGTVVFTDNGVPLGTVPLNAQGVATYTTAALTAGQHSIVATFTPTTGNTLGSSATLIQVVNAIVVGTDFILTVDPTSFSAGVGASTSVTVTITPIGNFAEPVALGCSGLPTESTCTFVTATIPSGGGSTLLAVHPEAPHNCGDANQYFISGSDRWFGAGLAALVALLFGVRRRKLVPALFGLMFCVLPMLGGCGWGNCTDLGTRPGSYTFSVTAVAQGSITTAHAQTMHMIAYIYGEPH